MRSIITGLLLLCLMAPAWAGEHKAKPQPHSVIKTIRGVASVYAARFVGRRTANGESLDREHLTAANLKLPFGTMVEVINRRNGRKAMVRVNDRGPYTKRFLIDLSPAAARALGIGHDSIAPVTLRIAEAKPAKRG